MKKLYEKSEIGFSLLWIGVYVLGTSLADLLSEALSVGKSVTFIFHLALTVFALIWLARNRLFAEYGLTRPTVLPRRFLFYIPLAACASVNLWFGLQVNMRIEETLFYVGSMLCVGFLEELIFRGFLFVAMAKSGVKSATVVSSLTFGIGHLVNLVNGSGAELIPNLCQVIYAIAFGFLFVAIFYRGGSLIPCIITHSVINALSAFAADLGDAHTVVISLILTAIAVSYAIFIYRTIPPQMSDREQK